MGKTTPTYINWRFGAYHLIITYRRWLFAISFSRNPYWDKHKPEKWFERVRRG